MICLINEKGKNMETRGNIKAHRLFALILAVMMIFTMMPMTGLTKAYADSSYPNCTIWLGGGITEGTPIKYGTVAVTVRSTQRTYTSSRDTRVSVDVNLFSFLDIKLTPDAGFTSDSLGLTGFRINGDSYQEVGIGASGGAGGKYELSVPERPPRQPKKRS